MLPGFPTPFIGASMPDAAPFDISGGFETGFDGFSVMYGDASGVIRTSAKKYAGTFSLYNNSNAADKSLGLVLPGSMVKGLIVRVSAWFCTDAGQSHYWTWKGVRLDPGPDGSGGGPSMDSAGNVTAWTQFTSPPATLSETGGTAVLYLGWTQTGSTGGAYVDNWRIWGVKP